MNKDIARLRRALKKERSPQKRIFLLHSLGLELRYLDIEEAVLVCQDGVREAKNIGEPLVLAEMFRLCGTTYGNSNNFSKSFYYLNRARTLFQKYGDSDGVLSAEYQRLRTKLEYGNAHDVLLPLHKILHECLNSTFPARSSKDRIFNATPMPAESKKNYFLRLGDISNALARAYSRMGDHEKAAQVMLQGIEYWREIRDSAALGRGFNDLGIFYLRVDKDSHAERFFKRSLAIHRRLGRNSQASINLCNLTEIAYRNGRLPQARRLVKQTVQSLKDVGLMDRAYSFLADMGTYERKAGFPDVAQKMNGEALDWIKKHSSGENLIRAQFWYLQNEFYLAPSPVIYWKIVPLYIESEKKKFEIRNTIARELVPIAEKVKLFSEAMKWMKKMHEYELHRIEVEQEEKIARLQIEQQVSQLEHLSELSKIKTRELEAELKSKSREIELLALQLARKGSFLASLKNQLASLKAEDGSDSIVSVDSVVGLMETMQYKDKEYEQLEERAQNLYKGFFTLLANKFPDLTQAEKKVCVLSKLGLKTKDIGSVLFSSVRTIENHSLSIRKKMNIPNNIRLGKFMSSL